MRSAIKIAAADLVATLLQDAAAGEVIEGVVLRENIARGHKLALRDIAAGERIVKYGRAIGHATQPIAAGEHVHTHNCATDLSTTLDYQYRPRPPAAPDAAPVGRFAGYRRPDGRVATRNEIWVLPTVGCVARTASRIAAQAGALVGDAIDGVHAFAHPHGCSQLGDDLGGTRAILAGLAQHPNAGGVLIVGLGCEENQIAELLETVPPARRGHIRTLVTQMSGDEIAEGVALVAELAEAARATREDCALSDLVIGVKCGGSDGLSGLTANPLVGRISDRVADAGGRVIFTEIPEMFGAEQALMDRAIDAEVFERIVATVNGFKRYFLDHGAPVSDNPSPGNVAGGITTLEEKSLGAVQKAGHAPIVDVIEYGGEVRAAGLTMLNAPGNDAVSSTALAAAGATVILFTTGRGTPLGFPVPTLKIASNSALAARKPDWIDFDAGILLTEGEEPAEAALRDILLAIASGRETAAERNDEREIAIWKRGVTL